MKFKRVVFWGEISCPPSVNNIEFSNNIINKFTFPRGRNSRYYCEPSGFPCYFFINFVYINLFTWLNSVLIKAQNIRIKVSGFNNSLNRDGLCITNNILNGIPIFLEIFIRIFTILKRNNITSIRSQPPD